MARDAQLAGDRVQSEYFLQFADHYFRMLGETRSRFDEQRRQRGDDSPEEDDNDDDNVEASEDERNDNDDRRPRGNGRERSNRNGRTREDAESDSDDERIALEVLPPAIGQELDDEETKDAPKPRRRARRPRSDDGEAEVAPAA